MIRALPDARILAFTLGLTFLTGVVFGLLPALRASRPDPWTTLKDTLGSIAGTGGSLFLRKGLVAAQVALSFLLLFGAGLFVRSLQNLKTADTGVALDNLVTFQLSPALSGYESPRAVAFFEQLLDNLRAVPEVKSAALSSVSILSGDEWDSSMSVEGHNAKDGEDMQAFMNSLSPGYFTTMGIPLLEGRDFNRLDVKENGTTAIVNRKFADHFFPGQSALGRHVGFGTGPKAKLNIEIVGVVANALYEGPREGIRRQVYIPNWGKGGVAFYVRTGQASSATFAAVRNQVRKLDASMPVYEMKTLEGQLDETLRSDRLIALLAAGFGLLATVLASIGLYGVMAFVVARRRKELGIRLALGAEPGGVIWLVMKEVLLLLSIGLAVGIPSAHGARTAGVVAALWHPGPRPLDRDGDGRPPDGGLCRGRYDPRTPRQPHRSDPGAEIRIRRNRGDRKDRGDTAEHATGLRSGLASVVSAFRRTCRASRLIPPRLRSVSRTAADALES